MMKISLVRLPPSIKGIYTDKKSGRADFMPDRLRLLAPEVADAFARANAENQLVVSDMYRSPDGSLEAIRTRRGALRPSRSLHNYGLAIDVDVSATMGNLKLKNKQALDEYMAARDFICCRLDHKRDFEEWHYSFLPGFDWQGSGKTSSDEGEAAIQRRFKSQWDAVEADIALEQTALQKLRLYGGEIDGVSGPRMRKAREAFCRAWGIVSTRDRLYYRTLTLVAADMEIA
jgi:hypothetical protein